jgi:hypothetical protein
MSDHPFEILTWAFAHDKDKLMDQAAEYALDLPVDHVPSDTPMFWVCASSGFVRARLIMLPWASITISGLGIPCIRRRCSGYTKLDTIASYGTKTLCQH